MRLLRLILCCLVLHPVASVAQSTGEAAAPPVDPQTYADIRAEIQFLKDEIIGLRNELIAGDPALTGVRNPGPLLTRVDALEVELRDLTDQVEQLGFRIDKVVADGTNRIGDLEFRLTELEGGDFSQLGETPPLGTVAAPTPAADALQSQPTGPLSENSVRPLERPVDDGFVVSTLDASPANTQDTVASPVPQPVPQPQPQPIPQQGTGQADFDAALAAHKSGDNYTAVQSFDAFLAGNPAGPLAAEAFFWKGEALSEQGNWNAAARSYLDAFSGAPQGNRAADALYRLGVSLGRLGQMREACMTLGEVGNRFPDVRPEIASGTAAEMQALSCG